MLIIILGTMGSGKTLFATYFALKSKVPVLANYKIGDFEQISIDERKFLKWRKDCQELKIDEIFELPFKKCKVILDEAYAYIESRVSMSKLNLYFSYILFQSRKKGIDIILTAQLGGTLDNRFIELADMIVYSKQCKEGFKYGIWYKQTNTIKIITIPEKLAQKIWNSYDTSEVVEPPRLEDLKTQIQIMDKSKLKSKVDELEKLFYDSYPNVKKVTLKMINSFLVDKGESEELGSYLYGRLQLNNIKSE